MASPATYAQKAYNKLVQHGKSTLITSYVDSYNSSTGANTRTATVHTVQTSMYLEYETKYIDNDLIQQGDTYIIVSDYNLDFPLANGQTVDSIWYVVSVQAFNYQDSVVAYQLQLRRV